MRCVKTPIVDCAYRPCSGGYSPCGLCSGSCWSAADAIFDQFGGIAGSAYFVAGFGMTALTSARNDMVVVPIRSGLRLRLGYNVGYLKFTAGPTWNPF